MPVFLDTNVLLYAIARELMTEDLAHGCEIAGVRIVDPSVDLSRLGSCAAGDPEFFALPERKRGSPV